MGKESLQFEFYAYNGPTDGTWTEHDEKFYAGQDFRTVERLKEYKDAGMTLYMPQNASWYNGQEWETSDAKMMMDRALAAGINKVVLGDSRIQTIPLVEGGIIGEGKQFKSEEELDETIKGWLSAYCDHPAFYGVQLKDEPHWYHLKAYGQIYRSIKRVRPQTFIQTCLNPMIKSVDPRICRWVPPLTDEETKGLTTDEIRVAKYKKYLTLFLDETGADNFMFDQYPMNETYIYQVYIQAVQAAAEVARERGVQFCNVTQTMCMCQNLQSDEPNMERIITENDAYWLNNMLIGFGAKQIAYYTYFPYKTNNVRCWFYEEGNFITRRGEKTKVYYVMQKLMREEQKLAPTVLQYNYTASKAYKGSRCEHTTDYVESVHDKDSFQKIASVEVDREVALITELCNKEGSYMYMLQNITDPIKGDIEQAMSVEFTGCTRATLFDKGERSEVELVDGKLTVKQQPGHAVYVIPY